jgi:hypothetical protein
MGLSRPVQGQIYLFTKMVLKTSDSRVLMCGGTQHLLVYAENFLCENIKYRKINTDGSKNRRYSGS